MFDEIERSQLEDAGSFMDGQALVSPISAEQLTELR